MFIAFGGTPNVVRSSSIYSCDIDGNADAKSNSTRAPLLFVSDVVMEAKSMSRTFLRMER